MSGSATASRPGIGIGPFRLKLSGQVFSLLATLAVCVALYTAASLLYPRFCSLGVFLNFFTDNAMLGVTAIGMTFVLLSGGIDLSVGAVIGCSSILIAHMVEQAHWHPVVVIAMVLVLGIAFGTGMGSLIHLFDLPPFLVTLAGMFFCRGIALLISTESISITHPFYDRLSALSIRVDRHATLSLVAMIFLAMLAVAIFVSLYRPFGRNVYAIGGSQTSATLMGLPVGTTKIAVYALSGFCSALAGVICTIYTGSGDATSATGLELDAIAAVVIGGTLLSGGSGYVGGTLLGVLIYGIIHTAINFQGTLSSWWIKIAVGVLLLIFIVLQKLLHRKNT